MSDDNPTGVNSFNGVSDEVKTAEVAQGLWDRIVAADKAPSAAVSPSTPQPAAPVAAAPAPAQTPAESVEAEAEADSSSEDEYADLDDYLSKSKLERESFLSLPVKLKVDGKDETVPLKELIESKQLWRHAQLETQKIAQAQKQWESERQAAQQLMQQQYAQAKTLAQLARQQLLNDYHNTDWSKYTAEEQLAIERNARAREAQINQHLSQLDLQQQQQVAKQIETERAKLMEALPDWRDTAKLTAAKSAIDAYASTRGFTQAELSGVIDHRHLLVLADAARAADLQAQVDTLKAQLEGKTSAAVKKVRAAPVQASAPGARQVRDPKVVALSDSRQRFLKNFSNPDAQAAYAEDLLRAGA